MSTGSVRDLCFSSGTGWSRFRLDSDTENISLPGQTSTQLLIDEDLRDVSKNHRPNIWQYVKINILSLETQRTWRWRCVGAPFFSLALFFFYWPQNFCVYGRHNYCSKLNILYLVWFLTFGNDLEMISPGYFIIVSVGIIQHRQLMETLKGYIITITTLQCYADNDWVDNLNSWKVIFLIDDLRKSKIKNQKKKKNLAI